MNRGEVWWVDFEPSLGGEIQKKRPAIIMSNNASNKYLNRAQVIPLTSNIDRIYPSEALITLNGRKVKAMADQITTASKIRFSNKIGEISPQELIFVEEAIKVQLDLKH